MNELATLMSMSFVHRAIAGGVLVALAASCLGVLVVMRRAAFYGDALAHVSLTGIALGLFLGLDPVVVALVYSVFASLLLPYLQRYSLLALDTLLGLLMPASLAVGVILISFSPGYQPDLISFLFGSILSISWSQLAVMTSVSLLTLTLFAAYYRPLVLAAFDRDYAQLRGVNLVLIDFLFHGLLALVIVAGVKLVGVVLINSMLIIPAATSRLFATSIKQMFWLTPIVAVTTTLSGIIISLLFDLPTGPAIVVVSSLVFVTILVYSKRIKR